MTYEELVRAIGPGFHPDIVGSEYASLPEGVTADEYETVLANAELYSDEDLYERALKVFREEGWVHVPSHEH